MMQVLAAVILVVSAFMTSAWAEEDIKPDDQRVLDVLAEAIASELFCPKLEVKDTMILGVLKYANIDPKVGIEIISQRAQDLAPKMKKFSEDDICRAALRLYGPDGSKAKGLMLLKQ
jgi:hypothetical protein